jgi:hypothetical protein
MIDSSENGTTLHSERGEDIDDVEEVDGEDSNENDNEDVGEELSEFESCKNDIAHRGALMLA